MAKRSSGSWLLLAKQSSSVWLLLTRRGSGRWSQGLPPWPEVRTGSFTRPSGFFIGSRQLPSNQLPRGMIMDYHLSMRSRQRRQEVSPGVRDCGPFCLFARLFTIKMLEMGKDLSLADMAASLKGCIR